MNQNEENVRMASETGETNEHVVEPTKNLLERQNIDNSHIVGETDEEQAKENAVEPAKDSLKSTLKASDSASKKTAASSAKPVASKTVKRKTAAPKSEITNSKKAAPKPESKTAAPKAELKTKRTLQKKPTLKSALATEQVASRDLDDEYGLKLFFQPIFIPSENRVYGYECLLRIVDKDLGVITPDQFLSVAQKNTSIMKGLEEWSMSALFKTAKMFKDSKKFIDMISLNIDTNNFFRKDFYDRISKYFDKINESIYLELKEDAFFSADPHVAETIDKLREAGIKIAVDDFTANFLSFEWGARLPFDMIKIDRAYIDRFMISPKARMIIEKIIAFGKARNLEMVAVGVENSEQEAELVKMGCDMLQGYYYSKPLQIKKLLVNEGL